MFSIKRQLIRFRNRFYIPLIKVVSNDDCLDYIVKNRCSVVRLGDGEFDIINGKDIPYQSYNEQLSKNLEKIALMQSNKNLLVCLPDVFKDLNRYNKQTKKWYLDNFYYENKEILAKIAFTGNWYGSTFISRPYIDLKDKEISNNYFKRLKNIWKDRDLLIVEGIYTRSGEGNDLFDSAKSVHRIICPAKNAYDKKDIIEEAIKKYGKNKLILLMLGPASKVIVNDMYSKSMQLIDLGHVDSEYEWYQMGATKKVRIPGKHTAEFNYDDDKVKLRADKAFEKQVIAYIN